MVLYKKTKKQINLVIEDYVLRVVETNGHDISAIKFIAEKPLPTGVIVNGKITDEIHFFNFIKDLVKELSLKNRLVRFCVPDSLVIMRQVEFPAHLKNKKEIKQYFELEIGKSIHLPFKEPVFDIHYLPIEATDPNLDSIGNLEETRTGTLFVAPEEEIMKYTEILADASLKPVTADVKALGIYRYLQHMSRVDSNHVYLFIELNLTSFNISVFNNHILEFLRYQDLDLQLKGWEMSGSENDTIRWEFTEEPSYVSGIINDQIIELERIMNFYRFSLHQGNKQVTNIIVLGDHPNKEEFYLKVKSQFEIPATLLKNHETKTKEISSIFIPALGLAIEGGGKTDETGS